MDPFLERHWGDVHVKLIAYICDELQPNLPEGLVALAQESVRFLKTEPDEPARSAGILQPDVLMVHRPPTFSSGLEEGSASTLLVDPPPIILGAQAITERWIEIIDYKSGGRVVTAIEVLSPTNKQSGYNEYETRRVRYLCGKVNLVEIDLLRNGSRNLAADIEILPVSGQTPYYVCVTRSGSRENEVYPLSLRRPLQNIGIPLRVEDKDVVFPLQRVIDKVYEMGRYRFHIDYSKPLTPPLSEADQQWAREILDASHS